MMIRPCARAASPNDTVTRPVQARKLWGGLLNRSRDLTRQACTYFPSNAAGTAGCEALARWIVAHAIVLRAVWREPRHRAPRARLN